jgi:hypothetical protein
MVKPSRTVEGNCKAPIALTTWWQLSCVVVGLPISPERMVRFATGSRSANWVALSVPAKPP